MKLIKKEFVKWLTNNQTSIVGCAFAGAACPITNYMKRTYRIRKVFVTPSLLLISGKIRKLPTWAKFFIKELDRKKKGFQTGYDCLKILEKIAVISK